MPKTATTSSWPFPPRSREIQFDEKWSFVGKKEKNCLEHEERFGDRWDHTAIDSESALLLVLRPGRRTDQTAHDVLKELKARTGGRQDLLLTSDEHGGYAKAIKKVYGKRSRRGKVKLPKKLIYATVRKDREKGRVVSIVTTLVFGVLSLLSRYLRRSKASRKINTSFVERHNATDRHQNARKGRKTLCFSKRQQQHDAVGYFVGYSYNFCWSVRTLGKRLGRDEALSPAQAAGLTDHFWTLEEWLTRPAFSQRVFR